MPEVAALAVVLGCGGLATEGNGGDSGAPITNDAPSPAPSNRANYFYCVVEPQVIMGGLTTKPCGDDGSHGCHYSDKVPEMPLALLPNPVTCAGGVPTDSAQIASGTPAATNYGAVSSEGSSVLQVVKGTAASHAFLSLTNEAEAAEILDTWLAP